MARIREGLDREAREYGAQVIDVRIKRADLPDGTPLESAFARMATARAQEAATIRARAKERADHPRPGRSGGGADLCRELWQGS
jgi:membrane protease subunit HflC